MIEVYIQSIILPSTKTDRTNEPIKDEEILAVFKESSFVKYHIKETGSASKSATGKMAAKRKRLAIHQKAFRVKVNMQEWHQSCY